MAEDAQGHALTGAGTAAAGHIDDAVRAFTLNYGDVNAHLSRAGAASPDCAMAELIKAWVLVLSNDHAQITKAREMLADMSGRDLNEREASHLEALRLASTGRWPSAVNVLDRHLMRYPMDLTAHQSALRLDGYLGRFHRTAGRAARALPSWSQQTPSYGIMLSFYGFGLEELGDYKRAEDVSRRAAELEPYGYWPHHAVSHVLEMTGRPAEGIGWMEGRLPYWSDPKCGNRVHIWWHKALFHVELGQFAEALALYDGEILTVMRPVGTQLCNATALLWRLETLGCDAGDRWQAQHALWQKQTGGMLSPFNEIHAAMTALRAGEWHAYDVLLANMRRSAGEAGELIPAYRDVAVPVTEAMAHFVKGQYADAVERLLPVQPNLWRMGGSTAQRDLVEWTLTEAAIRGGLRDVAFSLTNERLALRPDSSVNRHFLEEVQAIGA